MVLFLCFYFLSDAWMQMPENESLFNMMRGGNGVTGARKSVPASGHLFFCASLPGILRVVSAWRMRHWPAS